MKYAAKRIAMLLFTMVIVSLLAFVAFDVISGDPATAMLGTQATPERVAELRAELGLDRPLLVRYGEWLLGFFTGNLGTSYSYHQPVWELIAPKVGVTLCLSLLSFVLIAVISVPLGVRSATRRSQGC
ncbi:MAG: ABC transporter permease [Dysosmobacter sp.]